MPRSRGSATAGAGLAELRRSGTVSELLFLYECATLRPAQLRPVAEQLDLTIQAVSHMFRRLRRRGLIEVRDGRYLPTVKGVDWLHGLSGRLADDLRHRLDHLQVVRSTRAIAGTDLRAGDLVSLELEDGMLTARPGGRGSSRGKVRAGVRAGRTAEVGGLEGIVPLAPAPVSVRTLSETDLADPDLDARVRRALTPAPPLLAGLGLESVATLRSAGFDRVERFGVAELAREAAGLGVPVTVVTVERELPRLFADFGRGVPPTLDVAPLLREVAGRRGRSRRRR